MSFAIDLALSFLGLMLYSGVGMVTAKVTHVLLCDSKESITDGPAPFFSGIFWPLGLPMLIPFYLYALKDKVKLPFVRSSTEQKVLDYAETPLLVLAQIIAQRIIAYPDGLHLGREKWISEDKKIEVDFFTGNFGIHWFKVNGKEWRLSPSYSEQNSSVNAKAASIIRKALVEVDKFTREKAKADAEARAQMQALEAVESLLLQPEKSND
jgi:hypothetical protein